MAQIIDRSHTEYTLFSYTYDEEYVGKDEYLYKLTDEEVLLYIMAEDV